MPPSTRTSRLRRHHILPVALWLTLSALILEHWQEAQRLKRAQTDAYPQNPQRALAQNIRFMDRM